MQIQGEYGVALSFVAPILKAGTRDLAVSGDWTPASGDVQVSKDGGAYANITTLPTAATTGWVWALSATEMEASLVAVRTVDSATKAVDDQVFLIRTLPPGAIAACKLGAATANTITFPNVAPFNTWADNQPNGNVFVAHGGTGKHQAGATIESYVASTRVATLDRSLTVTFDTTTVGVLYPAPAQGTTVASYVKANVKAVDDGATEAANVKSAFASTLAEVSAVPAANASLWEKVNWLFAKSRNKMTQTATTQALRNDADGANIATSTVSDDGTTFTRGEFS